jgi:hypothetical protein
MARMSPALPRALVVLSLLTLPASAGAATRYATVEGTGGAPCAATAPCALGVAVDGAAAGDEVIVAPGTYRIDSELEPGTISLHGAAGQPRPWLVGSGALGGEVVSSRKGGTLRHLGIESTATTDGTLTLQGGVAEDLLIVGRDAGGGKLVGATGGTVLRDSAIYAGGSGVNGLRLTDTSVGGDDQVVNVTLIAPAGTGIKCDPVVGQATIVNTVVRGQATDIDATKGPTGHCSSSHSDYRTAPGLITGSGDIAGDPLFADAASGDYRVLDGTPTDDAGTTDPSLGTFDPAGCPRTLGLAPDIGAYEHPDPVADACASAPAEPLLGAPAVPAATGDNGQGDNGQGDDGQGDDQGDGGPKPVAGHSVVATPARGTVRIKRPGRKHYTTLAAGASIPVGSVIDARSGRATLVSALDAAGAVQSATFWGSEFEVRQPKSGHGRVEIFLRGGGLSSCPKRAAAKAGTASIARRRKHRRSLWASDHHGRYRTHGSNSAATARGTRWQTVDTCAGTLTRVTNGSVSVRDQVRHRTVIVRAGHRYLARAARHR